MPALARDLARANGLGAHPLLVGAGEVLPFRTGSFGAAFFNSVLERGRGRAQVLDVALRILRPRALLHSIIPSYASFCESHYRIGWVPHLPRALPLVYIRSRLWDPPSLATISFVTPGPLAQALRALPGLQVLSRRSGIFLRRLATLEFLEWGELGRVKAWVRRLRRLRLNRLAARLCVASGWCNPTTLPIEKT